MSQFRRLSSQRGTSLIGLVFMAIIVGFVGLMLMRVFPSINEYLTIKRAVTKIMKDSPGGASEIRTAFDRQSDVEYSISTLKGKDLVITPVGDRLRTSFAYNVEIPIFEPVYLLVKYEGSATSGGSGP